MYKLYKTTIEKFLKEGFGANFVCISEAITEDMAYICRYNEMRADPSIYITMQRV